MTTRGLIHRYISKMSEIKFRAMIIRILAGVEKSIEDTRESLCTEIKESSQDEIKNAITEMQTRMHATMARMDKAEQKISDLENKIMENNESGKKWETKAKDHDIRIR